jgi:hypothetical protein
VELAAPNRNCVHVLTTRITADVLLSNKKGGRCFSCVRNRYWLEPGTFYVLWSLWRSKKSWACFACKKPLVDSPTALEKVTFNLLWSSWRRTGSVYTCLPPNKKRRTMFLPCPKPLLVRAGNLLGTYLLWGLWRSKKALVSPE